jgi:hypothetical protein
MAYMSHLARRGSPRVPIRIPYNEYVAEKPLLGVIADVSERGLRVERLLRSAGSKIVQVEFELPGTNEVIWAKGELCFDRLRATPRGLQPVRASGVRLVAAASKHLRLLRDYVMELSQAFSPPEAPEARDAAEDPLLHDCLLRAFAYRS